MIMLSKFSSEFQNFLLLKRAQMNLELNTIIQYIVLKKTIQTLNFTHNFSTKNCEIQK